MGENKNNDCGGAIGQRTTTLRNDGSHNDDDDDDGDTAAAPLDILHIASLCLAVVVELYTLSHDATRWVRRPSLPLPAAAITTHVTTDPRAVSFALHETTPPDTSAPTSPTTPTSSSPPFLAAPTAPGAASAPSRPTSITPTTTSSSTPTPPLPVPIPQSSSSARHAAPRHDEHHAPHHHNLPYHLGHSRSASHSAPSTSHSGSSSAGGAKRSIWSRFVSRLNRAADEGSIAQLVQLGYGRHEAARALSDAAGDPRRARDLLAHERHRLVLAHHERDARRVYPECNLCRDDDRRRRSAERAARASADADVS